MLQFVQLQIVRPPQRVTDQIAEGISGRDRGDAPRVGWEGRQDDHVIKY